jgi:uncharacterized membrane protein
LLRRRSTVEFELDPTVLRAAGLAAIAGIRSMAAPALLAGAIRRSKLGALDGTPFARLGSDGVSTLLRVLMIGEMVGDKTPFVPARTSPGPVFGRAFSGALAGSALYVSVGRGGASGALLGVIFALAGVYAADRTRSWATQELGIPDPVFGHLEDWLVLFGGRRLLGG